MPRSGTRKWLKTGCCSWQPATKKKKMMEEEIFPIRLSEKPVAEATHAHAQQNQLTRWRCVAPESTRYDLTSCYVSISVAGLGLSHR